MSDITYEHIKAIAKLEKKIKQLKEKETTSDLFIAKLSEENQTLKGALKTCIDELMYTSTTGHMWMWAKSNEAVPERLLEIRKLIY